MGSIQWRAFIRTTTPTQDLEDDKDTKRNARAAFFPPYPLRRFQLSYLVVSYTYRLTTIHDQPIQTFDRDDAHLIQFVTTIQSLHSIPYKPLELLVPSIDSTSHKHLSPIDLLRLCRIFFFSRCSRGKCTLGSPYRSR